MFHPPPRREKDRLAAIYTTFKALSTAVRGQRGGGVGCGDRMRGGISGQETGTGAGLNARRKGPVVRRRHTCMKLGAGEEGDDMAGIDA